MEQNTCGNQCGETAMYQNFSLQFTSPLSTLASVLPDDQCRDLHLSFVDTLLQNAQELQNRSLQV